MLKSIKTLLMVFLAMVSLMGCVQSVDTEVESEAPKEFLRGYLRTVDIETSSKLDVTHELVSEDGESMYVRSLIFDLFADDYSDAILAIRGVAREVDSQDTITVDEITVEKKGLEPDSYDILTYKNPTIGFSLDLPIISSVSSEDQFSVLISEGPLGGEFVVERLKIEDEAQLAAFTPDVKLGDDQLDAKRLLDDETGFAYQLIRDDKYFYEVNYAAIDAQDLLVAERILQSLRFVPLVELEEDEVEELTLEEQEVDKVPLEDIPEDIDSELDEDPEEPDENDTFVERTLTDADLEKFANLESIPLRFSMYYPKNWYYAQVKSGYAFSNDPVEETGEWSVYVSVDGKLDVEIPADWSKIEKERFAVYGPASELDNMEVILSTLASISDTD